MIDLLACSVKRLQGREGLSVCPVPHIPTQVISNNKVVLCSALPAALSACASAHSAALLLGLFGRKECGNGWRTSEGGQAGGPKLLGEEGGLLGCQSGTRMGGTRWPERHDQGTRTAGGNWCATGITKGKWEVDVELELELELGRQKKGPQAPRPKAQKCG